MTLSRRPRPPRRAADARTARLSRALQFAFFVTIRYLLLSIIVSLITVFFDVQVLLLSRLPAGAFSLKRFSRF